MLHCLECGGRLELTDLVEPGGYPELGPDGRLDCASCGEAYPIVGGTPRMLSRPLRARLHEDYPRASPGVLAPAAPRSPVDDDAAASTLQQDPEAAAKDRTAESFAYEWERFGQLREEWRQNFLDYMRPHGPDFFDGLLVLDVGTGSGRHSRQAADLGAQVVALDLGRSIDVARRNLPGHVLTVQADAELLPLEKGAFDLVMSIGVLHHLPDPERALRSIVPYARPGGWLRVYLYWQPGRPSHQKVLELVTAVRRLTVRLPHRLLHALCWPLTIAIFALVVVPYRLLRRVPGARRLAEAFPLKTYADYPFGVCLNDQFDRFSAPIEHRHTAAQVRAMLRSAGLEDVQVLPNHGWLGTGRRPGGAPSDRRDAGTAPEADAREGGGQPCAESAGS